MSSPVVEIRLGTPSYPVLDAFRRDRSRCAFIMGPLGSGKTFAAIQRMLKTMIEQEPSADGVRRSRWLAVRNTYPDLTTTTIRDFRAIFTDLMGSFSMGGVEPPTYRFRTRLVDDTRVEADIIFLALDREDAVRRIRGAQITGAWVNEAKELVKPVLDMLDLRHGRYPSMADGGCKPTWHGIIGDTNAPDDDSWYYKLAEETRPEGWRFFRQNGGVLRTGTQGPDGREIWAQNPDAENLRNLPTDYYSRGIQGKSDDWIAVNLANEYGFTIDGKPVHPEYIDSVHCGGAVIPYDPALPLILGVDFGRTPAAAILQRQPATSRFVVLDEYVCQDMSQAVFAPELRLYLNANYPGAKVKGWSDPAGDAKGQATEDTPRRILMAAGIPVQSAPSNVAILRRAALAGPLRRLCIDGKPGLMVSAKSKMIRKGLMGGYCFRRLKVAGSDRYTDEPDKNEYSHPVEGLEYACLGEGEGQAALLPAEYDDREPIQLFADM